MSLIFNKPLGLQMLITVESRRQTAPEPSPNALQVASMFGLGLDRAKTLSLVPRTDLRLLPNQLVFLTGPSGSGKSTLLAALRAAMPSQTPVLDLNALPPLPDRALVDCFPDQPLAQTLRTLGQAGLSDAFVLLRKPRELSDGQRFRLRLAHVMALAPDTFTVILADEFAATLDRVTAAVVARNTRRWVSTAPVCLIAATTHDDLLDALAPDVLIEQHLGGRMDVHERPA